MAEGEMNGLSGLIWCIGNPLVWWGGLLGVLACVLLAVFTWPLYAFGQITSDVHAMKEDGGQPGTGAASAAAASQPARETAAPRPENPDELPEL